MLGFTYNMLQTAVVAVGGYVIGRNVVAVSASNREVALINEVTLHPIFEFLVSYHASLTL